MKILLFCILPYLQNSRRLKECLSLKTKLKILLKDPLFFKHVSFSIFMILMLFCSKQAKVKTTFLEIYLLKMMFAYFGNL